MKLTGQQFAQLQDALLAAFTEFGLRQMTRVRLDTTLEHVAGGDNLTEVVFNLIAWAEADSQVAALIAAACTENSDNVHLQALQRDAAAWFAIQSQPKPDPAPRAMTTRVPAPPEPLRPPSSTGFVGRQQELDYYEGRLREHGIVAITGMPGVGKSSLAAALVQRFEPAPQTFWHNFYQGEDVRALIWRLAAFLAHHDQMLLWELINSKGSEPPAPSQLDYAFQLIRGQGFTVVLDNVHLLFDRQGDDPLLGQTVERLEGLARAADAFVVLVSRSTPQFMKLVTSEPLRGLTQGDVDALLRAQNVDLPAAVRATLHARTEGNAELLRLAVEALRRAPEPAQVVERLATVDNIERYLIVEVDDDLDDADRLVMSGVAALLGFPATRDAIEHTLERSKLKRTLTYLANRYLLDTQQGAHEREYFQHAVLRDFYYDLLGKGERTDLHRRAGQYYSAVEHDPLRAAQHYLRAGDVAQAATLASTDVYDTLTRGQANRLAAVLAALQDARLPPMLAAQVKLAAVELHQFTRNYDAALAAGVDALALLEALGDEPGAHQALAQLCWVLSRVTAPTDPAQAMAYVQRGLAVAPETDASLRAILLIQQGAVHGMRRELPQAEAVLQQALALLAPENAAQRFDILLNLGVLCSMQGDLAGGAAHFSAALTASNQLGDPFRQLKARSNLSINKIHTGDWDSALVDMRYAYDLAHRLGDVRHHAVIALNLGDLLRKRGAYDEAAEVLETALQQAEAARFPLAIANARLNLAHLALAQQCYDEAAGHLDAAALVIDQHDLVDRRPEVLFARAELLLAQGELVTARELAEASVTAARQLGMAEEEGIALRVQARVLNAEERHAEAVGLLERSLACLTETSRYEHARSQLELGLTLERRNDEKRARLERFAAMRELSAFGAIHAD